MRRRQVGLGLRRPSRSTQARASRVYLPISLRYGQILFSIFQNATGCQYIASSKLNRPNRINSIQTRPNRREFGSVVLDIVAEWLRRLTRNQFPFDFQRTARNPSEGRRFESCQCRFVFFCIRPCCFICFSFFTSNTSRDVQGRLREFKSVQERPRGSRSGSVQETRPDTIPTTPTTTPQHINIHSETKNTKRRREGRLGGAVRQ